MACDCSWAFTSGVSVVGSKGYGAVRGTVTGRRGVALIISGACYPRLSLATLPCMLCAVPLPACPSADNLAEMAPSAGPLGFCRKRQKVCPELPDAQPAPSHRDRPPHTRRVSTKEGPSALGQQQCCIVCLRGSCAWLSAWLGRVPIPLQSTFSVAFGKPQGGPAKSPCRRPDRAPASPSRNFLGL